MPVWRPPISFAWWLARKAQRAAELPAPSAEAQPQAAKPQAAPAPEGLIGRLITWPPGFEYPAHATRTLDLGVIVSGRLELILDTGSTILEPGDVLVQRGTAHGWRVVGNEPCTWVVVMIDAPSRS